MVGSLTNNEEAQLIQTVEMFEVITQSQPQDYQSLEILKEAYVKLGRDKDAVSTSKRIAQAYVLMGQLSSAILEYESILQRFPDDADVLAALSEIESKANSLNAQPAAADIPVAEAPTAHAAKSKTSGRRPVPTDIDDGRQAMHKIFVDGKVITNAHFEECWIKADYSVVPTAPVEPFIHLLDQRNFSPLEKSLKLISDKSRIGYLPLDKYDVDVELARSFPAEVCRRWCILPFDRLSKSVLVASANPFNRQAVAEAEAAVTKQRLLWYLAPPRDIIALLGKLFR
jgi:tetratricopeptide (TPR) repeat protein